MPEAPDDSLLRAIVRAVPLLVASALLMGLAGYVRTSRNTPLYRATAEALVGVDSTAEQLSFAPDFFTGRSLTNDLALARSDAVLAEVAARLGHRPAVSVSSADDDTDVLFFQAVGTVPLGLAAEANTYASVFGEVRTERLLARYAEALLGVERLLNDVRARLGSLPEVPAGEASPEREAIEDQIAGYNDRLIALRGTTAALNRGTVAIITPAAAPAKPFAPLPLLPGLRAATAGLALALCLVVARELLDDTVRDERRLRRASAGAPLLALLPRRAASNGDGGPFAEAVATLRTSLQLTALSQTLRSLQITSPAGRADSSAIARQLAAAYQRAGTTVALLDGTSGLLLPIGSSEPPPATASIAPTSIAALTAQGTFVIVDSPPVLTRADALALAQQTDATVLVASATHTSSGAVTEALRRLALVDANVAGTVLGNVGAARRRRHQPRRSSTRPPRRRRFLPFADRLLPQAR